MGNASKMYGERQVPPSRFVGPKRRLGAAGKGRHSNEGRAPQSSSPECPSSEDTSRERVLLGIFFCCNRSCKDYEIRRLPWPVAFLLLHITLIHHMRVYVCMSQFWEIFEDSWFHSWREIQNQNVGLVLNNSPIPCCKKRRSHQWKIDMVRHNFATRVSSNMFATFRWRRRPQQGRNGSRYRDVAPCFLTGDVGIAALFCFILIYVSLWRI